MKEGDKVFLDNINDNGGGQYEPQQNPFNVIGNIYGEDTAHDDLLLVKWSNGDFNSYLPSNLKLATQK